MSRSSDGYYRSGPRKRTGDGYGGGFSDYGDSYGSRRSSRDSYDRHRSSSSRGGRSHGGRGMMVNPWEGGVVPGSGGARGGGMSIGGGGTQDIVASINQLSRMDNPESELALNILNAVLGPKEESSWGGGGRGWEGQSGKRRVDWDSQYSYGESLGDGILPTPHMPPRKLPRREGTQYSWGVVGGFNARMVGRAMRGGKKKVLPVKKPKPATTSKTTTKATEKSKATSKTAEGEDKDAEKGKNEGEEKEGEGEDATTEGKEKAEGGKEGEETAAEGAEGDGKVQAKKASLKDKKKEECPVPVSYLRCHLCQMTKFNSPSNFMDHVRSKKHRRMILYYGEKISATEKLLKAQSWLKSQRNIVAMSKMKGKITRCVACECPIKGGRWTHIHIREHMLLYHFTKCFVCKLKFMDRSELEQHKLTAGHMKAQFLQDNIARERYLRWTNKNKQDTNIPEQKQSQEFHETVQQMFMNNLDTQVWNKDTIPIYDPARPAGLNHMVKHSQFMCSVCPQKVSQTAWEALEHCKTREHYDCLIENLKAQEQAKVEKEKKEAESAEKEKAGKKVKEEKIKTEKEVKKEEGEEGKENDTIKEEEEEEGEEEEEEEEGGEEEEEGGEGAEDGMKDMANMQVIDEEGEHEGGGGGGGGGEGEQQEGEEEEEGEGEEEEEEEEEGAGEEAEEIEDMEEVGEDMDEVGEDLEEMEDEEEEEDNDDDDDGKGGKGEEGKASAAARKKEEEEEEEDEDEGDGDKSSTTASSAAGNKSSAPAPAPARVPAPAAKGQINPAQTRSSRGRGVRGGRGGARRGT